MTGWHQCSNCYCDIFKKKRKRFHICKIYDIVYLRIAAVVYKGLIFLCVSGIKLIVFSLFTSFLLNCDKFSTIDILIYK